MVDYLTSFSRENGILLCDEKLNQVVDSEHRRDVAMMTYCHWLILRLTGVCDGPAVLALWRITSRSPEGGMIRGFKLTVDEYQAASSRILTTIRKLGK